MDDLWRSESVSFEGVEGGVANANPTKRRMTITNLNVPDNEIFNLLSIICEIGGINTKAPKIINIAAKYSFPNAVPKPTSKKNNPSIQRRMKLNVILIGSFCSISILQLNFFR